MPLFVILIVLGVILICAAYYLTMPPEIAGVCKFGGIVCLIFGVVLAIYVLLFAGGGLSIT